MENSFKMFDPTRDDSKDLPDIPGNYLVVLRSDAELPKSSLTPEFHIITYHSNAYKVIYTGISQKGIRSRDYKQHFTGNAGKSTLRKSLGSLMGFPKIPRSMNKPEDGKTKFNDENEEELSLWMKKTIVTLFHR